MVKRIKLKRAKTDSADASIAASSSGGVAVGQHSASGSAGAVSVGRASNNKKSKRRKFGRNKLLRSKSAPVPNIKDDGQQTESIRSYENQSTGVGRGGVPSLRPSMLLVEVDDGTPSNSPYKDLQRVIELIKDERHLVAYDLFVNARGRLVDERMEMGAAASTIAAEDIANNNSQQQELNSQQQQQTVKNKKNKVWWRNPESNVGSSSLYDNAESSSSSKNETRSENEKAWALFHEKQQEFQALENRAKLFTAAKENLAVDDDWIHAQTLFGVSTSYRREADDSLSVKIEGELHGVPLFEQLVVLREVDLYETWAPFMSKSKKLAQLDKLDVVAWYIVGVPMLGLTRDACYRAVGCDCMQENGSVLLVAVGLNDTEEHGVKNVLNEGRNSNDNGIQGNDTDTSQSERNIASQHLTANSDSNLVDTTNSTFLARDAILETLEIPPIPQGIGRGRMTIRNFAASIDILSPTGARTKMVVNVDPNLQLIPQFMIDFCMKRMCGILLSRLQATARKVVNNPVKNPHARRMREDVLFYRDWLLPKFQIYCNELGWQMPKVGAFEIDLEAEGMGWIDENDENDIQAAAAQQQQLQCQLEGLESVSSRGGSNRSISNSSLRSPISFLKFRRGETQEEKIAAARLRAAKLIQPQPFSETKVQRLNQLKAAKTRAEERLARDVCISSSDSISSHGTTQTLAPDFGEQAVRYFATFIFSISTHLTLDLLRGRICEWTSLVSNEILNYALVSLEALCLWALLASTSIYAFINLDFGQKKLVSKMDYGRKLFIQRVKHISLLTSVAIATISCAFDLVAKSTFRLCSVELIDLTSLCSKLWRDVDAWKVLSALPMSAEAVDNVENMLTTVMDTRFWTWSAWAISNVYSIAKVLLSNAAISASSTMNDFVSYYDYSADWDMCKSNDDQWGSRALSISSYLTLHIGVFVVALVLLGHMALPKRREKPGIGTHDRIQDNMATNDIH